MIDDNKVAAEEIVEKIKNLKIFMESLTQENYNLTSKNDVVKGFVSILGTKIISLDLTIKTSSFNKGIPFHLDFADDGELENCWSMEQLQDLRMLLSYAQDCASFATKSKPRFLFDYCLPSISQCLKVLCQVSKPYTYYNATPFRVSTQCGISKVFKIIRQASRAVHNKSKGGFSNEILLEFYYEFDASDYSLKLNGILYVLQGETNGRGFSPGKLLMSLSSNANMSSSFSVSSTSIQPSSNNPIGNGTMVSNANGLKKTCMIDQKEYVILEEWEVYCQSLERTDLGKIFQELLNIQQLLQIQLEKDDSFV